LEWLAGPASVLPAVKSPERLSSGSVFVPCVV